MTHAPSSYRDVVNLWKDAEQLADDLGELGVTVRQWRNRNSIPPQYWRRVIEAGAKRDIQLNMEQLAAMAEQRQTPTDQERAAS